MHHNNLTPAELERLACLAEECSEVIKVVNKIIRHGYGDEPDAYRNNRRDLEEECGHVLFWIYTMGNLYDMGRTRIENHMLDKANKVKEYLHHQEVK